MVKSYLSSYACFISRHVHSWLWWYLVSVVYIEGCQTHFILVYVIKYKSCLNNGKIELFLIAHHAEEFVFNMNCRCYCSFRHSIRMLPVVLIVVLLFYRVFLVLPQWQWQLYNKESLHLPGDSMTAINYCAVFWNWYNFFLFHCLLLWFWNFSDTP